LGGTLNESLHVHCRVGTVRVGVVTAHDRVDHDVRRGAVHALVGQNGAGKSTLARVIAGLQATVSGGIAIDGTSVAAGDHLASRDAGVEMVHQHRALVPDLTIAEALELRQSGKGVRPFRRRAIEETWSDVLAARGIEVDTARRVGDLSVELVQSIEIAAADPGRGGLLILDEPTAVLPPPRVDAFFERLRATRDAGVTIVIVLHKLDEVRRIADTVTVLRNGRVIVPASSLDVLGDDELTDAIIGEDVDDGQDEGQMAATDGATTTSRTDATTAATTFMAASTVVTTSSATSTASASVSIRGVHTAPQLIDQPLTGVDLDVEAGSLVGVAGVEGNGQRSLVELLVGLVPATAGSVSVEGDDWTDLGVAGRRRLGLRCVPYDRFAEGSTLDESLWRNVILWEAERFRRWPVLPLLSVGEARAEAEARLTRFGVAYSDIDQPASDLSGGNLQRLILAREVPGAQFLVAAQPTRGLDIGGIRRVWDELRRLADRGVPVLVISSDLDELLAETDRVCVMRGGRVVADHRRPFERVAIGRDMIGAAA
ncbi:MAG: ATP-binding cassette domain-containing protein, partial [Actinomycetota bacterium]